MGSNGKKIGSIGGQRRGRTLLGVVARDRLGALDAAQLDRLFDFGVRACSPQQVCFCEDHVVTVSAPG